MYLQKLLVTLLLYLAYVPCTFSFEKLVPDFKANYVPDSTAIEAGLWMEMNDYENQLKHSPIRVVDAQIDAYLKDVLCRLSPEYCNDVRMYVIRNPLFNAGMAPNGMMLINTGFLLRMRNEAQLASVLGHELGHYLKRHSIKSFEDASAKSSFSAFFMLGISVAAAAGGINPDIGGTVVDLANIGLLGSIYSYSRDNEREADKYGIQLLHDADLDINEAKQIWINLTEEKEAADEDTYAGIYFFSTHPDPGERIENLERHATEIGRTDTLSSVKNKDVYWENIAPILPMAYEDELNLRQLKQSEYLLKNLLQDNVSPGLTHYYLGELYRLKKDDEDKHLIKTHYESAMKYDDRPTEVYRALGLIEYKERNFSIANRHFDSYLALKPDAHDKEMIEFYKNTGE